MMERTPTKQVGNSVDGSDEEEFNEAVMCSKPPYAKLAVLSRKSNEITKLLDNPVDDLALIKSNFTEYLIRYETLLASAVKYPVWLNEHLPAINEFRDRVQQIVHGTRDRPRKTQTILSNASVSSRASSARFRIAEEKAAAIAKQEMAARQFELRKRELELKLDAEKMTIEHETKLLELNLQKEQASNEETFRRTSILEKELERIESFQLETTRRDMMCSQATVSGAPIGVPPSSTPMGAPPI